MIIRLDPRLESLRGILDAWPSHFARAYAAEPRQSKHESMKKQELLATLRNAAADAGWECSLPSPTRLQLKRASDAFLLGADINWVGDDEADPVKTVRNLEDLARNQPAGNDPVSMAILFAVVWRNASVEAEGVYRRVRPFYDEVDLDVVAWAGTRMNGERGDAYSCFLLGQLAAIVETPQSPGAKDAG